MGEPQLIDSELINSLNSISTRAMRRSLGPQMSLPVIEGMATLYLRPHIHRGKIEMFEPGCFAKSLVSGNRVRFLLDHDDEVEAASTSSGLVLIDADDGLLFNLDLSKAKNGGMIARMVDIQNRPSMSVGYTVLADRTDRYAGLPVRVIIEATLHEISLCKFGVVKQAFAYLTDAATSPMSTATERSAAFEMACRNHPIRRTIRQLRAKVGELADILDRER
jgi:HK97 family phage prohead protease